ncbi:MAG: hypothetical protein QM754_18415 [Tepidisphaeraceae bacterium]
MSQEIEYAVFGAGYGSTRFGNFGSGDLAYQGESKTEATAEMKRCKAGVARLRKQPANRNASDTYAMFERSAETRWQWVVAG